MSWVPRAGRHLLAVVGAAGVFAAAAMAGAHQTTAADPSPSVATEVALQTPAPADSQAARAPRPPRTPRERSVAGSVREMRADGMLVVETLRGQELRVQPAPGALVRLNGKASALDGLKIGDRVVILGQAQPRRVFLAHAITARRARSS